MSAWTELSTWMPLQDVITPTSLPASTGASTGATSGANGGVGAGVADNVGALPSWLLVALFVLVVLIIVAMFALSWWSLNAPRSTLRNVLGRRWFRNSEQRAEFVTAQLISTLATSARSGKRTTRTTLAVGGFSILFVVVIAVFGLSGTGVRDLRSQVVASLTTLVATIAGFYFGAQTAAGASAASGSAATATPPKMIAGKSEPQFTVGEAGHWDPSLSGSPPATVQLAPSSARLPEGLTLEAATGAIFGTPTSAGATRVTLVANNGLPPAATLSVTITVAPAPAPAAAAGAAGPAGAAGDVADPAVPADGGVAPG